MLCGFFYQEMQSYGLLYPVAPLRYGCVFFLGLSFFVNAQEREV
jgi:hypothetical protein